MARDINHPGHWEGYTKPTGSLTIPSNVTYNGTIYTVTEIGSRAFETCVGLASVIIPNTVTSVHSRAFYECTSLASIYIPSSVQSIASNAFQSCSGLISIAVSSNNSYYDSRNSCNAIIRTSTNDLIVGCKNTVIPNTVTSIGPYAFYGCSGLESIISHAAVAPSISGFSFDAFTGVSSTIPVFIPCGSAASYASEWSYFPNRIEVPELSLIVTSDNNTMGFTQILSGPNCSGSMATILATAYTCYRFAYWSDGSTDNPRQIAVTQDTELTAYFEADSGTEVEEITLDNISLHTRGNRIVIEGTTDEVRVFDMTGRNVRNEELPAGVYLVKVGDYLTRKVVVIR
ncbi:MAG: leucine-rich repeat domain-containing protein [Bacteroidales bacterium]|nr:leucine-rich repeat domain-containing protein [Bacteroidales bacterium]